MPASSFQRPATPGTLAEAQRCLEQAWDLIEAQSARFDEQAALIAEQARRIDELVEQLGKSSRTSSKPPSTDSTEQRKKRRPRRSSGRRQGAQPGHEPHQRTRSFKHVIDVVATLLLDTVSSTLTTSGPLINSRARQAVGAEASTAL